MQEELTDRYGPLPRPVENLLAVARLRARARRAGLTDITQQGNHIRFSPVELPESRQVRASRLYPKTLFKLPVRTMLVPVPKAVPGSRAATGSTRAGTGATVSFGAPPLRDIELLAWCEELIDALFDETAAASSAPQSSAPQSSAPESSP